jgi:hypothetical protein
MLPPAERMIRVRPLSNSRGHHRIYRLSSPCLQIIVNYNANWPALKQRSKLNELSGKPTLLRSISRPLLLHSAWSEGERRYFCYFNIPHKTLTFRIKFSPRAYKNNSENATRHVTQSSSDMSSFKERDCSFGSSRKGLLLPLQLGM